MLDIKGLGDDPISLGRGVYNRNKDETEKLIEEVKNNIKNSDVPHIDNYRELRLLKIIRRIQSNEEKRQESDLYIFGKVTSFYISESDIEGKENEPLSEHLRRLAISKELDGERYRKGGGCIESIGSLEFVRYSKGYEIFRRWRDFLYSVQVLPLEIHPLEMLLSIDDVFNYLNSHKEEIDEFHYSQLSSEEFSNLRERQIIRDDEGNIQGLYRYREADRKIIRDNRVRA